MSIIELGNNKHLIQRQDTYGNRELYKYTCYVMLCHESYFGLDDVKLPET